MDETIQLLEAAHKAGIKMLKDLKLFMLIARHEGNTTFQITGLQPRDSDPAYAALGRSIRKLMCGDSKSDGLKLCRFIGKMGRNQRPIVLTAKGRRLSDKFQKILNN